MERRQLLAAVVGHLHEHSGARVHGTPRAGLPLPLACVFPPMPLPAAPSQYYYYFKASLSKGYRPWWRKYITTFQLVQFVTVFFNIFVWCVHTRAGCGVCLPRPRSVVDQRRFRVAVGRHGVCTGAPSPSATRAS